MWVGIHAGTFDTYNGDEPLPDFMESLVEDGDPATVVEEFANTNGTVWDGVVVPDPPGPICTNATVTLPFEIDVVPGVVHYFSYASMTIPSNDAWVSNGDPMDPIFFW